MPKKRLVIPRDIRLTQYVSSITVGHPCIYGIVTGFFVGFTRSEESDKNWLVANRKNGLWRSRDVQVRAVYEFRIEGEWSLIELWHPIRMVTFHSAREFERLYRPSDPALFRREIEPFLRLD